MDKCEANLVSIIMPVYKAKDTIARAMDSIVSQSYTNWELIIIVEQDTDNETIKIIEDYQKEEKRIKFFRKKGMRGVAVSLNQGIALSKGTYIARMDADDYSNTFRLMKQVDFMEKNKDVVVVGTFATICTPHGKEPCLLPMDYEHIKATMLFWDCIVHPSVMFRADVFRKENLKYNENCIAEDYELWLRIIKNFKFNNINEALGVRTFF